MYSAGTFNVLSGQQTAIAPLDLTQFYGYVVLFNNTSVPLQVAWKGWTDLLQPNMANSYKLPATNPLVYVSPITTFPDPTYVGVVQAVYYLTTEGAPNGYPMPLSEFPGGGTPLLLTPSTPTLASLASDFIDSIITPSLSIPLYTVAAGTYAPTLIRGEFVLPPGAGSVSLQGSVYLGTEVSSTVNALYLDIVGVQSGSTLGSFVYPGNGSFDPQALTWTINNSIALTESIDTSFYLQVRLTSNVAGALWYGQASLQNANISAGPSSILNVINPPGDSLNVDVTNTVDTLDLDYCQVLGTAVIGAGAYAQLMPALTSGYYRLTAILANLDGTNPGAFSLLLDGTTNNSSIVAAVDTTTNAATWKMQLITPPYRTNNIVYGFSSEGGQVTALGYEATA